MALSSFRDLIIVQNFYNESYFFVKCIHCNVKFSVLGNFILLKIVFRSFNDLSVFCFFILTVKKLRELGFAWSFFQNATLNNLFKYTAFSLQA